MQLLRSVIEPELQDAFEAKKRFDQHGTIDHAHLWTIFLKGDFVVTTHADDVKPYRAYKIEDILTIGHHHGENFAISTDYVDWDGDSYGISGKVISIPYFAGTQEAHQLPICPLSSHPQGAILGSELIARGRRFEELTGIVYKTYDGFAIKQRSYCARKSSTYIKGRVILDTKLYFQKNTDQSIRLGRLRLSPGESREDTLDDTCSELDTEFEMVCHPSEFPSTPGASNSRVVLTDEERLICTPYVRSYVLTQKRWLEFFVDHVSDIPWNHAAFDALALPGDHKYLLLAFARSQIAARATPDQEFDDVIEGKGKSMAVLLEGPPGTGKTLTVESIAEEMRVPVVSLSADYLAVERGNVQRRLEEAFELAAAWNAVILLDEADIFLEKRSLTDIKRNQLVFIFLQTLEYYTGTIFLTTNRVQCIDPAFHSRIHLALPYPELSVSSRHKVWSTFLTNLKCDTTQISDEELDIFAKWQLNGRQIKNAIKMAGLLANVEKGPLKMKHIETVAKVMCNNKTEDQANEGRSMEHLLEGLNLSGLH